MSSFHPIEAVKAHPYIAVGGVVGLVLIWVIAGRSKSTASSGGASAGAFVYTPDAASVAAGAAISQSHDAVQMAAIQANASQNLGLAQFSTIQTLGLASTNAQQTLGLAQSDVQNHYIDAGVTINSANTGAAVDIAKTNANAYVAAVTGGYNAATSINASNNATALQNTLYTGSAVQSEVSSLYQEYLGRAPDNAGLNYWTNFLANGGTTANLTAAFTNSAEYKAKQASDYAAAGGTTTPSVTGPVNGTPDAKTLVDSLYSTVLGRAPDAAGEAFWTNAINSGTQTPAQVAAQFASTPAGA